MTIGLEKKGLVEVSRRPPWQLSFSQRQVAGAGHRPIRSIHQDGALHLDRQRMESSSLIENVGRERRLETMAEQLVKSDLF